MRKMLTYVAMILLTGACGGDGAGMPPDGRQADAGNPGDGNDSFANAVEITLGSAGQDGVIVPAGDHDYYRFTASADSWVVIFTTTANVEVAFIDTAIRLYDSSETLIAQNDDTLFVNVDSEIIAHIVDAGTYYVEVFGDVFDDAHREYNLRIVAIEPAAVGIAIEGSDDPQAAASMEIPETGQSLVLGSFDNGTDLDVFAFSSGSAADVSLETLRMPEGTDGNGSTVSAGQIWVTTASDVDTIIARIDGAAGQLVLAPTLSPNTNYLYWIAAPSGATVGDNPFYVFKARTFEEGSPEPPGDNNAMGTASPLALEVSGSGQRSGYFHATLTDGDVDYFKFEMMNNEQIEVICESESAGSGVRGLHAQVLRPDASVVLQRDEDPANGLYLLMPTGVASGMYYLRLTATGQDPDVTGNFVRCVVFGHGGS